VTAQTWNKITTAVGSDGWNPVLHMKGLADTADVVIPVASAVERDGLAALAPGGVLPIPTYVFRTDINSYQTWNGVGWLAGLTERITVTTADATWAYNVALTRSWNDDGTRSVSMGLIVARTGGGAFTVAVGSWTALFANLIPAGWRPDDNIYTCGAHEFAPTGAATGAVLIQVRTTGQVDAQGVTGSISMGTPTKVTASANWTAA
jgi:hypothetical protein